MTIFKPLAQLALLMLGLMLFPSGCVLVPQHSGNSAYQEGSYDRDNGRWYHNNGWQSCTEHDEHCR